ncbi:MAG: cupin domain-containing protein [Solirubrobacterales bacterium]|nr:cupin domain-containing protein [Solirubrobacterales bacterium]MBA3584443.1 cupin domain-containing protein [Gemmatimonadota bacterium]
MDVTNLARATPFTTKDGSQIRELVHPTWSGARNQSLAEATLPVAGATTAHYHRLAEELYVITAGTGRMRLADEECDVALGDCVIIPPGVEHKLVNTGQEELRLLCCCSPAYAHEDTVLTEPEPSP